jgi:hypothetical protein
MLIVKTTIEAVPGCPISFSDVLRTPKDKGEKDSVYEERVWRERIHVNPAGSVFIPSMAIKNTIEGASQYLSENIEGKGKATYTKNIRAGILIAVSPVLLRKDGKAMTLADVKPERVFVPSNGKRGGSTRVWKIFGDFFDWHAEVEIHLIDRLLIDDSERIEKYLSHAGTFIGLGRWRPQNGGLYGRFKVTKFAAMKDLQAA